MVHSTFAQGHVLSSTRDPSSTLGVGIPKSPSFHSGLDLVASASVDSLVKVHDPLSSPSIESKNPNLDPDEPEKRPPLGNVYFTRSPDNGFSDAKNSFINASSILVFGIRKEAYAFNNHLQLCKRRSIFDTATRLNFQTIGRLPLLTGDINF
ncbi:hypothetical protein AMK59_1188 [Oryctes borbonicus]|uniref:Uncharacterized protein n=1 Tax=Oryctes borbonicus TaxID=1629725 RepID=A0A0T6BBN2_9SCAR|nr:hypothetical protein AMK59_1188 [Oryctes borbonicus]